MASLLQIRNVPDTAKRILKARAAEKGESLNSYMLRLIEREVSKPDIAEVLTRAGQRAERSKKPSSEEIRKARIERGA